MSTTKPRTERYSALVSERQKTLDPDITPEAIEQQIKAFLAKGGKLQQIPDGKAAYVPPPMRSLKKGESNDE